jgi:hypothetical protein
LHKRDQSGQEQTIIGRSANRFGTLTHMESDMMKNLYTLLALLVACALVSCKDVPTDAAANADLPEVLYGHWRYSTTTITEPSMNVPVILCIAGYLELNDDGTWDQDLRVGGEIISEGPGTWTGDSTSITLNDRRGRSERWVYQVGGGYLHLYGTSVDGSRQISYELDKR